MVFADGTFEEETKPWTKQMEDAQPCQPKECGHSFQNSAKWEPDGIDKQLMVGCPKIPQFGNIMVECSAAFGIGEETLEVSSCTFALNSLWSVCFVR